ncbi:hypothetical protein ACHAXT_004969 [Thalassiosira profunda]
MIRLNSASSRRPQTAANKVHPNKNIETETHDDMYDDATNGDGTAGRVNQLFEELLGDNASAIGSVAKTKTEETALSSVFQIPTTTKAVEQGAPGNRTSGDAGKNGGVLDINSGSNPTLGEMKNSPQEQQVQEDATENDEDTLLTKPREIVFDQTADDVSALFGGGATTAGVESYMGSAHQRRNRSRPGARGGMGMFGVGNRSTNRSKLTGGEGSTLPSHGITTILEEIGLGSHSSKKRGARGFNGNDTGSGGDTKGHSTLASGLTRSIFSSNWRSLAGRSPSNRGGRRRGRDEMPPTIVDHLKMVKQKTWVAVIIAVMFVTIQFRTVHKRDRATMDHLNWRFRNHRYQSAGMSDGIRHIAMEHVEGDGRRRGGSYASEEEGIGDVIRKTVPLLRKTNPWEEEKMMMDDQIFGEGNLRGGQRVLEVNENAREEAEREMQERQAAMERKSAPKIEALHRMQQPQQLSERDALLQTGTDDNEQAPEQPAELADAHPLLQPKQGLSMADALDKLNAGADKLSDIDPRPQQKLSNDIVPSRFQVFADLKTPYVVGRDTPYFWHIPRSGGVVVKTMLSHCLGQTLAAEVGELDGHENDQELKVMRYAEHNYTNVNIATPEGIARALNLGLVPGHLADTLVSAHVDLIPSLFNANDRARAFVLLRHPVDRAASMFHFLKGTGYPPLKNMTVDDYAKSELIENNWMVRILSESMTGPIDMDNLEIAKEVLRRKFIVGLLDNKRGSFARFDHYFKWKDSPHYEKEFGCRKQLMDEKYVSRHPIRRDSETWKLLLEQNRYDVHLYDYAKELFAQQSYIFGL